MVATKSWLWAGGGVCLTVLLLVLGIASPAGAVSVDLTAGIPSTPVTVNGATFLVQDPEVSGTGRLDSFVRIKPRGNGVTSQGYNTSRRPVPFDEDNSPWTHNMQIADFPIQEYDGTDCFRFLLDADEDFGQGDEFLSIDAIQVYISPIGSQNTTDLASLGALRYDLDWGEDSEVLIDTSKIGSGNGRPDMTMYIPVDMLYRPDLGDTPSYFLYLYTHYGDKGEVTASETRDFGTSDGFEEWAIDEGQNHPPPPPPNNPQPNFAGVLTLLAAGGVVWRRLKKR